MLLYFSARDVAVNEMRVIGIQTLKNAHLPREIHPQSGH